MSRVRARSHPQKSRYNCLVRQMSLCGLSRDDHDSLNNLNTIINPVLLPCGESATQTKREGIALAMNLILKNFHSPGP